VIVASLLSKHMPSEIKVDWDGATRTPVTEVTTQVRDQFDPDEVYTVPASKVVVSLPITGTTEMLDYQASTFGLSGKYGKVSGGCVVVEIVERTLNADTIRAQVDRVKQDVEQRAAWANGDLATFQSTAEQSIRSAFERRKERILNDREVEDALGIPVRTSSTPRPPVPARRAQFSLQARKAQAGFVPEPVLEDAIYQDVLQAVVRGQPRWKGLPAPQRSLTRRSFATCCLETSTPTGKAVRVVSCSTGAGRPTS
jgi:hypothetical protein